jgi:hypothetical protein
LRYSLQSILRCTLEQAKNSPLLAFHLVQAGFLQALNSTDQTAEFTESFLLELALHLPV